MFFGFRGLLKIMGYLFAALSIILLIASIFTYFRTRHFIDVAVRGEGKVIKLVESHDKDNGTTFRPVFVFRDSHGTEHEIYSSVGSYPPAHKVGDKVTVLYRVEEPENASLDGFFDLWLLPFVLGIIGAVQMIVALIALFVVPIFWKPKQQPAVSIPPT